MRMAKVAMTRTSPSNGPRRFSHVRARFELEIAGLEFVSAIILGVVVSEPRAVAKGSYIQVEHSIRSLPPPHAGCPRGDPGPLPVSDSITSNTDRAEGAAEPEFRRRPDYR